MAFLEINGLTVPIENASGSRMVNGKSEARRSHRGQIRHPTRGKRRVWEFRVVYQDHEDSTALQNLIWGDAHFFDFKDGIQSATGLQPIPGFQKFIIDPSFSDDFSNTGAAATVSALADDILFAVDAQLQDDWTIMWREYASSWKHVGRVSSDLVNGYDDGVSTATHGFQSGSASFWTEVSDGLVYFRSTATANRFFDDFVILPYAMSTRQMQAFGATSTKFGPAPVLRLTGDFANEDHIFAVGEVTDTTFVAGTSKFNLGWVNNAKVVDFKLTEVPSAYVYDDEFGSQGAVTVPNVAPTVNNVPNLTAEVP